MFSSSIILAQKLEDGPEVRSRPREETQKAFLVILKQEANTQTKNQLVKRKKKLLQVNAGHNYIQEPGTGRTEDLNILGFGN